MPTVSQSDFTLPLIGRDRFWMDKLTKSLRTDLGELGQISETARGNTFEIRYRYGKGPHEAPRLAKVTIELLGVEVPPMIDLSDE